MLGSALASTGDAFPRCVLRDRLSCQERRVVCCHEVVREHVVQWGNVLHSCVSLAVTYQGMCSIFV